MQVLSKDDAECELQSAKGLILYTTYNYQVAMPTSITLKERSPASKTVDLAA